MQFQKIYTSKYMHTLERIEDFLYLFLRISKLLLNEYAFFCFRKIIIPFQNKNPILIGI